MLEGKQTAAPKESHMTLEAPGVAGRRTAGSPPDSSGFRRRHRLLAAVLALHLPGLAALAVATGHEPHEILVEAAVVVLAIAVGAFLEIAARLRALALTAGLLWCSAAVGLLVGTVISTALHAAVFGLLAAAHVGASWRPPRAEQAEESAVAALDELDGPPAPADDAAQPAASSTDRLVEVQDVYTGVWSAKRLVRPTTRLVRLEPAAEPAAVTDVAPRAAEPAEPAEPEVTRVDDDRAEPAPAAGATDAPAPPRDHELTREVLEALHLGTVEPTPAARTQEHATSGSSRS